MVNDYMEEHKQVLVQMNKRLYFFVIGLLAEQYNRTGDMKIIMESMKIIKEWEEDRLYKQEGK